MRYEDWRYQDRRGWRSWWQWYKWFLLGWLLVTPINIPAFWPDVRCALIASAVGFIITLIVPIVMRLYNGAGPFKFK